MELGLKGKVAAVTGGTEGIGRSAVLRLVAEGRTSLEEVQRVFKAT